MAILTDLGSFAWTILAFVTALSIIVAVHEYGHYIIGRISGIKAEVFSLGFGPKLISRRDRHGTLWQVAAIPLGGYVRFLGDANAASAGAGTELGPDDRRHSLSGAPLWARFATVAAGPIFNFILSIVVFGAMALWQGIPVERVEVGRIADLPEAVVNELRPGDQILALNGQKVASWKDLGAATEAAPIAAVQDWTVLRDGQEEVVKGPDPMPAVVSGIAPRSAAATAGLKPGDVILAVDGTPVTRFTDLRDKVGAAEGKPVVLQVWRKGAGIADYTLAAREQDLPTATGYEKRWLIGVTGGSFFEPATRSAGLFEAARLGATQTWGIIASSVSGLWATVTGQIGSCNIGGAISIAETTGQAASAGGANFIWWIAVLSTAIGFLNLLPVPVLDGGHLMFFTYEAIAGRPASDRVVNVLTFIGLAMVLSLMIFGLSNDLFCR
ncbi:RIP metalloprotease RseP [Paracoccus aminophilus]|uniref:Zinc metalloprotease n=1 Tax=Paracoccus aminophilus JCM 7686 TaxID=1367847 RepID=S5XUS6_PARAH|nr:RIP metalloprotease RseP [Paracoccus aminophilus]AGT08977.1 regulator of sigma E protease [Paracoccus aminophilus JCM 7686]